MAVDIIGHEERMRSKSFCLRFKANRSLEFMDITRQVQDCLTDSGVQTGLVVVYSKHTTAAVKINENEPLLLEDLGRFLERIAPRDGHYRHNDFSVRTVNMTDDECPNGHSHCQQLLLGTSETIPVMRGIIQLGRWQSIFLIELDHPRTREVIVQVLGE